MQSIVVAAAIAIALSCGLPRSAAAADIGMRAAGTLTFSAAKNASPRTNADSQIACTPAGCQRIPPGCHPEPGFDFRGNPTGFDVIVCQRR